MYRQLIPILGLLWVFDCNAAEPLHIMDLQWRSAEELVPILRPMAGEDAGVSGSGYTLFLRAPHQRLQELKAMVLELDRAPRQLMISVFQGRLDDAQHSSLAGIGPGVPTRRVQTRGRGDLTQRIRVSEGQRAFIANGKVQPLPPVLLPAGPYGHPTLISGYRETVSGFLVRPLVSGEQVSLEISTARAGPGQLPVQQGRVALKQPFAIGSSTRVVVEAGAWIPLGGSSASDRTREQRPLRRRSTQSEADTGIFLKVELLP